MTAKGSGLETLMIGGSVAAAGLFLWTNRAKFGLGTPAAPADGSGGSSGGGIFSPSPGITYSPGSPILTPPVPIGPVTTTLPNGLVNVQPNLTVAPITQTAGCVIGPYGGLVCPDFPAAQVLAAQTDSCLPASTQEIDTCQGRKPLWSRDQCVTRLHDLRNAYCVGKQNVAAAGGNTASVENWITAMAGDKSDYYALTGVYLT